MGALILSTVGTSLLSNLRRHLGLGREDWPDIRAAVAAIRSVAPTDRMCGAEINSISHLVGQKLSVGTVSSPLSLHFLVSDTDEGYWTAEALTSYYRSSRDVRSAASERVAGLTGADYERFAGLGLRSLVKATAARLTLGPADETGALKVINATGGYKAQISFAGLICQALGVPVVYLFEQFPRCIEMPPLPVAFDRGLWIEHHTLFSRLSDELQVPASEFDAWPIDPALRHLLDREAIDGIEYIALSPILELMHQSFELVPPANLVRPCDAEVRGEDKVRLNEAEMAHAPKGSRQCIERLARLPWVTRVSNEEFVNTAAKWRVKTGGDVGMNEVLVQHGDGSHKALEIRLTTTCTGPEERQWCLEELAKLR